MKKASKCVVLLASLVLCLGLSACGNGKTSKTASTTTTTSQVKKKKSEKSSQTSKSATSSTSSAQTSESTTSAKSAEKTPILVLENIFLNGTEWHVIIKISIFLGV